MAQLVKNPVANAGNRRDAALISGIGRSFREGNGNPLQYSCLGNPMDRLRWESKFLLAEPKNGIHEHANTNGSKQIGFIKEEESRMFSA